MEIPKDEPRHKFCDLIKVIRSIEIFLLALNSGGEMQVYIFTPSHAKRLHAALGDQIVKHEAEHGVIEMHTQATPMLSPFQKPDIRDTDGEGEKPL